MKLSERMHERINTLAIGYEDKHDLLNMTDEVAQLEAELRKIQQAHLEALEMSGVLAKALRGKCKVTPG